MSIMKKLFNFLKISALFLFIASCTFSGSDGPPGPRGPAGQDGLDGSDGVEFVAIAYEFVDVTFSGSNDFSVFLEFPEADWPLIFPSDVVLVYQLVGYDENLQLDTWEPLPRTLFNQFGTFIYGYDFTEFDARVFLDANFDLGLLPGGDTDNKIFRVVIIPAENTSGRTTAGLDHSNYYEVMNHFNMADEDVVRIK